MARDEVSGRRDPGGVGLLNLIGVRQNVAELSREQLDLGRVELEVGECGHRLDLLSGESGGHDKC